MKKRIYLKILISILIFLNFVLLTKVIFAVNDEIVFSNDSSNNIDDVSSNIIVDKEGQIYPLLIQKELPKDNEIYNLENSFALKLKNLSLPIRYNLKDEIKVNVYNQNKTNNCWIYGTNSVLETTIAKEKNKYTTYDATYTDEQSAKIYNRQINAGGNPAVALSFYTNGYGPLSNDTKKVDTQIGDYVLLSTIYKGKNSKGELEYNWGKYSKNDVIAIRNKIKEHIKTHGAVTGYIYANLVTGRDYYSNSVDYTKSEAYFCDYSYNKYISTIEADHQVTIIGWDDNYSKTNFNSKNQPQNDGAYIVLNSWGKEFSSEGCFYVSYEDTFIESCVYGIYNIDKIEYDNLYQHDELGMSTAQCFDTTVGEVNYGGNVFTRKDLSKTEELTEVSVANRVDSSYEIYVNSRDGDLDFSKLTKVATTEILPAGFHTIKLNDKILLTGEKFAIVVKYGNEINGKTYMGIEYTGKIESVSSSWANAKMNPNESFIYYEKSSSWLDLKIVTDKITDQSFKQICNICIKAFTEEVPILSSDVNIDSNIYNIKDNYIYNIPLNTTNDLFLKNITTNANIKELYENEEAINNLYALKTGMILILTKEDKSGKYILAIKGDCNKDGKADIKDIFEINKYRLKKMELTEEAKIAADVNNDDNVAISDIFKLNKYRTGVIIQL